MYVRIPYKVKYILNVYRTTSIGYWNGIATQRRAEV